MGTNDRAYMKSLAKSVSEYFSVIGITHHDLYNTTNSQHLPGKLYSRLQYLSINHEFPAQATPETIKFLGSFKTPHTEFLKILADLTDDDEPEIIDVQAPPTPPTRVKKLVPPPTPSPTATVSTTVETCPDYPQGQPPMDWSALDELLEQPIEPEGAADGWFKAPGQNIIQQVKVVEQPVKVDMSIQCGLIKRSRLHTADIATQTDPDVLCITNEQLYKMVEGFMDNAASDFMSFIHATIKQ
jgi:hypothetical protein